MVETIGRQSMATPIPMSTDSLVESQIQVDDLSFSDVLSDSSTSFVAQTTDNMDHQHQYYVSSPPPPPPPLPLPLNHSFDSTHFDPQHYDFNQISAFPLADLTSQQQQGQSTRDNITTTETGVIMEVKTLVSEARHYGMGMQGKVSEAVSQYESHQPFHNPGSYALNSAASSVSLASFGTSSSEIDSLSVTDSTIITTPSPIQFITPLNSSTSSSSSSSSTSSSFSSLLSSSAQHPELIPSIHNQSASTEARKQNSGTLNLLNSFELPSSLIRSSSSSSTTSTYSTVSSILSHFNESTIEKVDKGKKAKSKGGKKANISDKKETKEKKEKKEKKKLTAKEKKAAAIEAVAAAAVAAGVAERREGKVAPSSVDPTGPNTTDSLAAPCTPLSGINSLVSAGVAENSGSKTGKRKRLNINAALSTSTTAAATVTENSAPSDSDADPLSDANGESDDDSTVHNDTRSSDLVDDTDLDLAGIIAANTSPDGSVDEAAVKRMLSDQKQKRRRLARKAELARLSRKRKKTKLNDLELQVERLQKELEQTRRRNEAEKLRVTKELADREVAARERGALKSAMSDAVVGNVKKETTTSNGAEDAKTLSEALQRTLADLMVKEVLVSVSSSTAGSATSSTSSSSSSSSSSITPSCPPELSTLINRYVDLHSSQLRSAGVHLDSLRPLLSPSLPLEFLSWIMSQSDKFVGDSHGLWSSIWHEELNINEKQVEELQALRRTIKKQHGWKHDATRAFGKLQQWLDKQGTREHQDFVSLVNILTPEQLQRYIKYVQQYGSVLIQIKAE